MSAQIREETLELMRRKDHIEEEIRELSAVLTKNGVGMTDPLVDTEGFPINSIDVYQVRHARHRIICLQNDHKALMKDIENRLGGYYSSSVDEGRSDSCGSVEARHVNPIVLHKTPFAKVTTVAESSPAAYAGIAVDDLIVEFGSVNATNFKSLTAIAAVVQHSEGQQVNVKLQRGDRYIVISLMPKRWSGTGLLGCNIAPFNM